MPLEFSELTRKPKSYPLGLPIEIHLQIQSQVCQENYDRLSLRMALTTPVLIRSKLLSDPDITISQLRSLRLVCKTFDDIWHPFVMKNLVLIPSSVAQPPYHSLVQYLQLLIQRKRNTTNYTTLTIRNWNHLETEPDRFISDTRQLWEQGLIMTLIWILWVLFTYLIITLVSLALYLLLFVFQFHKIPYHIRTVVNTWRARSQLALLPKKLDAPNIRCCRLFIQSRDRDWVMDHSIKILLSLPQLAELELKMPRQMDLKYIVRRLAPLTSLRKLTLLGAALCEKSLNPVIRPLSTIIARNGNLTHLRYDLRSIFSLDLIKLFSAVPTDKPLRLCHVSLYGSCKNFEGLTPHTQSLLSFEYHSKARNPWCIPFMGAKVFPTTIKVDSMDHDLITFIKAHPGITSLAITTARSPGNIAQETLRLFQALAQHTETLRQLSLDTRLLALLLRNTENEMDFLQSARSLQELALETDASLPEYQNPDMSIHNEQRIFPVIALLSPSMTVVVRTGDKAIYLLCIKFCLGSENSLIRDVARRMVYQKRLSRS